jgi:hypothetical protein
VSTQWVTKDPVAPLGPQLGPGFSAGSWVLGWVLGPLRSLKSLLSSEFLNNKVKISFKL